MAKQIWNNPITDNTDWGGDESTNNLPVSGNIIQQFIKDKFKGKVGCIYYDTTNNRYMMFADETARDTYLENPQDNTNLILGVFDAPFNYSAEINLISGSFNAILKGTTNNYIRFTFDVKNKNGQSTGEDVLCTFTFTHGSIKKTVNQKYRFGTSVSFNVDSYLETGTNTITIAIVGQNSLAATTMAINYQVIDLNISDNIDLSRVYKLNEDINIEVPYNVSGAGIKTMEWYLDGELIPYVKDQDEITEIETSRIKYLSLEGVEEGVHSLQYRASVIINGEKFYSNILYRDIIVYNEVGVNNMVAVGTTFPSTADVLTSEDQLRLYGVQQYMSYPIRIGVFNPTHAETTDVNIYIDDKKETTLSAKNDEELSYNVLLTSFGEKTLKISTENSEYNIGINVEKSDTSVEEITQDLTLALSAIGKSNNSVDKNKWTFGDYSTSFNDFKWNDNCGWNDNSLVISEGAYININYAPLASASTNTGKTFEIEFASSNVANNDAIICDLRNSNGTGILITASEASIISSGGSKVSTKYKAEENIRIGFVINRSTGVANKTLVMMYINGILSGAATYAVNDNFVSDTNITINSSDEVSVILKSIRIYDIALSSNQILNNYILYRPTSEELLKVYDRNNIYEEGTSNFSTDKLAGQLPIMIVTGNIPALEATTDKNLQIDVDVEYINFQNPKLSFSVKNGALRPQGTSSMSYPKKNFRLYTQKKDTTILYDADGNIVESKLYAFKEGAQPVNCWCFKADYAESSGTHNTGVARLWNEVFKNFQINGEYKGRTKAQQVAIDGNYPYDVRTCIDGFPILMFYRLDENSPLVFIGKYNFNNDKSTESVFGYKDIPGFDNSKTECWETLSNGNHLALFQDVINWDGEWSDAFEARYPDGNTDTTNLKTFATWMSSVTKANFASEKWNHFDVYKVAAYYIYVMRFGAVDQTVKNTMLATEDGVHWFFENYDNDTIGSLRNDGLLIFNPTITRQTLDDTFTSEVYAYAGHDSRLWNMLEDDEEFMSIVKEVDQALYTAGLTYDQVIEIFDNKQANKWCERIYNQDAQYKYIGPFADRGINNLFMLQGSRQSHRKWWFSERFALMDSLFISGEYKSNVIELKLAGAPIGLEFDIKAGKDYNYGYGVNNVPISFGVNLKKGQLHTFTTTSVLNVGDPLRIYAAPYLKEVDLSNLSEYIAQISIANVYSERLGSKLRQLILGGINSDDNTSLTNISGLNQAVNLEDLEIRNFSAITSIDLRSNNRLKIFDAYGTGLTSVTLPKNAPIESLALPATLQTLNLNGLYNLDNEGLIIQNNGNKITSIEILDCPKLNTKTIVENFLLYKQALDSSCSLTINGINWTEVDPVWLIRLGNFANLNLKGVIEITDITIEQLTTIQNIFGNNCFSPKSELYIKAPIGTYFIGPDSVRGYSNTKYEFVVVGAEGSTELYIENNTNSLISFVNGRLIVGDITSNTNVTLVAKFVNSESGVINYTRKTVSCVAIKYPASGDLIGNSVINKVGIYEYNINFTGIYDEDIDYSTAWSLTGEALDNGYIEEGTSDNNKFTIIVKEISNSTFTLSIVVKRKSNGVTFLSKTITVDIVLGNVILTKDTKPSIMAKCYSLGFAANSKYMTDAEADAVTSIPGYAFEKVTDTNFDEFAYFTNVKTIAYSAFRNCNIKEITVPLDDASLFNGIVYTFDRIIFNSTIASSKINRNETKLYFPKLKTINGNVVLSNATICSFPKLEKITIANIFDISNPVGNVRPIIRFDSLEYLDLPKLTTVTSNRHNSCYSCLIYGPRLKEINVPKLVTYTDVISTSGYAYDTRFINEDSLELDNLNAPLLEQFCIIGTCPPKLTDLNLPSAKIVSIKVDGENTFQVINLNNCTSLYLYLPSDSLTTINIKDGFSLNGDLNLNPTLDLNFIKKASNLSASYAGDFDFGEDATFPYLKNIYSFKLLSLRIGHFPRLAQMIDSYLIPNVQELYINDDEIDRCSINVENTFSNLKILSIKNYIPNTYRITVPNAEKVTIGFCAYSGTFYVPISNSVPYLELINYNTSIEMLPNSGKHLKLVNSNLENYSNSQSLNNVLEILELQSTSLSNYYLVKGLPKLNTIIIHGDSPIVENSTFSDVGNVGGDVEEGTSKIIYVPIGASGYDSAFWVKFCNDTGFTISYTLPADETTTE